MSGGSGRLAIVLSAAVLARAGVAALPRQRRRRGRRRSRAARHLVADRERRLDAIDPGDRLELAGRLGRPRLRHDRRQHRAAGAAQARLLSRRLAGVASAASMDGLRHRLPHRRGAMGEGSQQRAAGQGQASEEQLCLGDRGHRRRARLLLLRQRRALRLRLLGQAGVVETDRSVQDAEQLGHGRIAGAPSRPHLHRQRQRRAVVPGGLRHADRAPRSGRSSGRRARTGRRRSSGRTTSARRS